MRALLGLIAALALAGVGCDCDDCGDYRLEVVDAETGEVIPDAEAVVAVHVYGRRHRVESLPPGEYRLWVRARGYRQITEAVDLSPRCADFEGVCPGDAYVVALERRR